EQFQTRNSGRSADLLRPRPSGRRTSNPIQLLQIRGKQQRLLFPVGIPVDQRSCSKLVAQTSQPIQLVIGEIQIGNGLSQSPRTSFFSIAGASLGQRRRFWAHRDAILYGQPWQDPSPVMAAGAVSTRQAAAKCDR